MATIKTELTTNEFLTLYSDSQWVRDFSDEGVEVVLNHIEEMQQEGDTDWTGYFMEASESKPLILCGELIQNHGEDYKDELIEISEQLNLTPERYTDPDDEDNFDYDRFEGLSFEKINKLYQLDEHEEFQQEAIEFFIDRDLIDATQIDNKNWVVLVRR